MTPRFYLMMATMSLRRRMSYRSDFWISSVAVFLISFAVVYMVWRSVYLESGREEIGGFTFHGMVVYYLLAMLLMRMTRGGEGASIVSAEIYDGSLTRYLVYPTHYFALKYFQRLGEMIPVAIQAALLGVILAAVLGVPAGVVLTPATLSMAAVAILLANVLCFLMFVLVEMIAFWADNVWALNIALGMALAVLGGRTFPLSLFPEWFQQVMVWLPFQYTLYTPVAILLGEVSGAEWLRGCAVSLGWCVAMGAAARVVWRRGSYEYSAVGI